MIKRIDTICVLIVFCVFAMAVLMVLMLSGRIYKNMTDIVKEGYGDQTCLSYIWSKIKNEDKAGGIYIENFHGYSALCLEENYGDVSYRTIIYYYDGWVRELFSEKDLLFMPEDGLPVIEADSLMLEQLAHGLIKASTKSGSLFIYPRSSN